MLENLLNYEPILIKAISDDNKMELLYLTKSSVNEIESYSLSLFEETKEETRYKGSIDFYVDFDSATSIHIASTVCQKNNSEKVLTYLFAYWLYLCESLGINIVKSVNDCNKTDVDSIITSLDFTKNASEYVPKNINNSYIRARRIIDEFKY